MAGRLPPAAPLLTLALRTTFSLRAVRSGRRWGGAHAVSSMNAASSASKACGVSHCGAWPAPGMVCTAPRHSVGMESESEPGAVDELLLGAVQHGERRLQITHNRDFVAIAARREARAEKLARAPVRPQRVFDEERRHVGEAGLEHRGDEGRRLVPVDALGEDRRHRRIGMECLAPLRRLEDRSAARRR